MAIFGQPTAAWVNPTQNTNRVYLRRENYFSQGAQWPPRHLEAHARSLKDRRKLYDEGYLDTSQVPEKQFSQPSEITEGIVNVNWYRRIAQFWADVLYANPPAIESNDDRIQEFIEAYNEDLVRQMYLVALGASVEGVGVLVSLAPGGIGYVNASRWYPVVAEDDETKIVQHNLVYPYVGGEDDQVAPNRIKVVTIEEGSITTRWRTLEGTVLGEAVHRTKTEATVGTVCIPTTHSATESHYGESDMVDMYLLVEELNRRLSKNSEVINRHSNPHLIMPSGALQDGQVLDLGESQAFEIQPDAVIPQYLTWQANLEASFRQIEMTKEALHMVTSLSPAIFGELQQIGSIDSGAALKRLALPALQRLLKLRIRHERTIKGMLTILADNLRNTGTPAPEFTEDDITITWPEVFRDGERESVEVERLKLDAGLTTREASIQRLESVGPTEAEQLASAASVTEGDE